MWDDHHDPHHEAVIVRELCIAIDENRFTVFTAEEMCHLVEILMHYINIYEYTTIFYSHLGLLMFIRE